MEYSLKELARKFKEKGALMSMDQFARVKATHISLRSYHDVINEKIGENESKMSPRKKKSLATTVAKISLFIGESPEEYVKVIFPSLDTHLVIDACNSAKKVMAGAIGNTTQLKPEDLDFLREMINSSTKPITFKQAYDLLCQFRS